MEGCQVDEKEKNAQKIKGLTKGEKKETLKMVNKMTATVKYIRENTRNPQWMHKSTGEYEGLAGGLTFIHTLSLINLTRWLKGLTIVLIVLTIVHIVLILAPKLGWF